MKISDAVNELVAQFQAVSRSKLKLAMKIEMSKGHSVAASKERVQKLALEGGLNAIKGAGHTDTTGAEVMARQGQSRMWRVANPHGYMAPNQSVQLERQS